MEKFYLLYNNKKQEKLLTTANSEEKLKEETEYYTEGVWFSYTVKEGTNLAENEKEVKGIVFPTTAKVREISSKFAAAQKPDFKWLK